jgi:hypothetical protein
MGQPVLHLGQGRSDFDQVAGFVDPLGLNPRTIASLIPAAMQRGQLVVARDEDSKKVLGSTVLDTTSIEGALFVPFLLVGDSSPVSTMRRLLSLIFSAAITGNVKRIVVMRDADPRLRQAVRDFNAEIKSKGVRATLRASGTVRNQFGDGRNVTTLSLFIPARSRPNLTANLDQAVNTLVRTEVEIAARMGSTGPGSVGGPGHGVAFCSGCNEKRGKEKEGGSKDGSKDGKDKEGGKEGKEQPKEGKEGKDGVELTLPPGQGGKVDLELADHEAASLFGFYDKVGVRKFIARAAGGGRFAPLV